MCIRDRIGNPDGRLRPGQFARLQLESSGDAQALLVPEQALMQDGDTRFLYTVVDGKAKKTVVKTGARVPGKVETVSYTHLDVYKRQYENYPLWFTILTHLGFKVVLSGRSSHEVFESGMESIPSENVCYPAKLAHGHLEQLLDKGIRTIFYPCVTNEVQAFEAADNNFNCPIVAFYPQVLAKNVDALRAAGVRYLDPFVNLANPDKLAERLVETFEDFDVSLDEAREAVACLLYTSRCV